MDLQKKLNEDLKKALKSKDQFRLGVLRLINSSLKNKQIEKGKDAILAEDDILQVLAKEAKKRKESIEAFEKGGRPELAESEKKELVIIEEYLPQQMSRAEIGAAVEKILDKILRQGSGQGNFGLVMKGVMKELKGKADAKIIGEIIHSELSRTIKEKLS